MTRRWVKAVVAVAFVMAVGEARAVDPAAVDSPALTLAAVGDLMLGTTFPEEGNYLDPGLRPGVDPAAVIDPEVVRVLRGADLTFGNLEGTLFDGSGDHKVCSVPAMCYLFRMPEYYGEILAKAGFDVVSIANNHSGDFRENGRAVTRRVLESNGIKSVGLDLPGAESAIVTAKGLKVAFIGFAPNSGTLSVNQPARAAELVASLAAVADVVVVSIHAGAEGAANTHVPFANELYLGELRGNVNDFAHTVIDAGADVVLGHGPHVPRAVEIYKGRFIAYSLGNFWTGQRINTRGISGIAPLMELTLGADGRVLKARLHSTRQEDKRPRMDPQGEALALVASLTGEDFHGQGLGFRRDGWLVGPGLGAP